MMKFLQNKQSVLSLVFWLLLTAFIAWDFAKSADIN
jgi:hypothetical protein